MDYQAGNNEAIGHLFHRYKTRILFFCLGIVGSRAEAEDIAADVFVAVAAKRNGYRPGRKFSTWLYTIARNKCVDRLRRQRRLLPLRAPRQECDQDETVALWDPPAAQESALQTLERDDIATYVRQALARLPYEQREAIILQQYHDRSYDEISHILRCSLAKVKILIFRGKERLRVELASLAKELSDDRTTA